MLKYPKCAASAKRQRAAWDKLHEVRASRLSGASLLRRRKQESAMNGCLACLRLGMLAGTVGRHTFFHRRASLVPLPLSRNKYLTPRDGPHHLVETLTPKP